MPFLRRLVRNVTASILLGSAVAWALAERVLDLTPGQAAWARGALAIAVPAEALLVAALLARLVRPLRRAVGGAADEAAVRRASEAARTLPRRVATAILALGLAVTAFAAALVGRQGFPLDLAIAGCGIGAAATLLGAMLGYAFATSAAVQALEALGPGADHVPRGSVRGKVLLVGLGVDAIAVLLSASAAYAGFRADTARDLVEAAERAQASVVSADVATAELVVHVAFATGAPTALVDPAGAVVKRLGELPPSLAGGASGSVRVAEPPGWLVRARAPGGGAVVSWLAEDRLRPRWRAFVADLAVMAIVACAAGALLAWVASRAITVPFRALGRAADRIGAGDLTATVAATSRDEMGELAAEFRRMAQGLKELVGEVLTASEGVRMGARDAATLGDRVRSGAAGQQATVGAMRVALQSLDGPTVQVTRGVEGLSDQLAAVNAAVRDLGAALAAVRARGEELERAAGEVVRDLDAVGGVTREADHAAAQLAPVAAQATANVAGLKASLGALERAAGDAETSAAAAADVAARAGGMVEETVQGVEAVRAAVADANRRIGALGRRSEDAEQVVDFVAEVAGRTNLLSLNASIIASQAGEHGKAFGVVADQIRDLAAQIARSTSSIGEVIHAVREEVGATAALIERGDALAGEGAQRARGALEALDLVRRSTRQGREVAAGVAAAAGAHAAAARDVALSVQSIVDGTRAVAASVQQGARGVAAAAAAGRGVQAGVGELARSLGEQEGELRRDLEAIARLERLVGDTARAVDEHGAATRRVHEALRVLLEGAGRHGTAAEGLAAVAERLGSRASALAERVGRFKV